MKRKNEYLNFGYRRVASIPAQIVVDLLRDGVEVLQLDDDISVKLTSSRIRTYTKGVTCVHCHLEGKYFAVERHKNDTSYHLNIYAIKDNGEEVMITSDHIKAKSKNGSNAVENRQPMCKPCNETKGSFDSIEEAIAAHKQRAETKPAQKTRTEDREAAMSFEQLEEYLYKRTKTMHYATEQIARGAELEKWQYVLRGQHIIIDRVLTSLFGVPSLTYAN